MIKKLSSTVLIWSTLGLIAIMIATGDHLSFPIKVAGRICFALIFVSSATVLSTFVWDEN